MTAVKCFQALFKHCFHPRSLNMCRAFKGEHDGRNGGGENGSVGAKVEGGGGNGWVGAKGQGGREKKWVG